MEMLFHHFALENRVQMWQVRLEKCEGFQQSRADYRDHRSGRLLFVRAASGKGVHGARNRAAHQQSVPSAHRCALRVRMDAPRPLRHEWHECIGNRTASLFATAFFTITNRRGAEKTL